MPIMAAFTQSDTEKRLVFSTVKVRGALLVAVIIVYVENKINNNVLEEVTQILDDTATNVDTADKVSINIKYKYISACVLNIIGTNWVNFFRF